MPTLCAPACFRFVVALCFCLVSATAFAQNATPQTVNDVVRSSSQSLASVLGNRIEFVNAPRPQQAPGHDKGQDNGIPVPGKDRASLDAPGLAGNAMLALAAIGKQTGLSAGDEGGRDNKCGVWAMSSVNWLGNNQSGSNFDGNLYTVLTGFDYRVTAPLVVGVSLGYQWIDLTTHYNQGWFKSGGFTAMPYLSYAVTPNLVADASFGLSFNNANTSRADAGAAGSVTGHFNSLRSLGVANLAYYHLVGNWTLSLKAGTILTNEHQYYYVENDSTRHNPQDAFLGELIVGGKAGYRYRMFIPQIGVNYVYDYAMDGHGDRDEVQGIASIGLQATDSLLFNLECSNSFFRDHTRNTGLSGTMRFEF